MESNMETESTLEGPADSIAEDLAGAFDGYEETSDVETANNQEGNTGIESEDASTGDGEVAADNSMDQEDQGGDKTGDIESGDTYAEGIEAPEHWAEADRELFNNAPEDLRQWLLDRHKSMEGDYTRKNQEIADFRRDWEPVQEMYAPYADQLRQIGLTPQQHIQNLANADIMMNQDPINGIKQIAQMYNVDLTQLESEEEVNPEIQTLRQELNGLKGQINSREQAKAQERQQAIMSDIEKFAESKDESGNLEHPHFEEVVSDMMVLAQAVRAQGQEPKLSDLYEKACWSNTSVRQKIQEQLERASKEKAEKEARAKAAKAKKAGREVSGSPSEQTPTEELDLRESIAKQLG